MYLIKLFDHFDFDYLFINLNLETTYLLLHVDNNRTYILWINHELMSQNTSKMLKTGIYTVFQIYITELNCI